MNRKILVSVLLFALLPGQVEFKHECGHAQSAYRWLDATSTMTEDQGKLDISYYGINLEIDFSSEMISISDPGVNLPHFSSFLSAAK